MKFPVLEPLRLNGKRYRVGGDIELDPKADQALVMSLVREGAIRDVRPTIPVGADHDEQTNNGVDGQDGQRDATDSGASGEGGQVHGASDAAATDAGKDAPIDGAAPAAGEQSGAATDAAAGKPPRAPVKTAAKAATKTARRAKR